MNDEVGNFRSTVYLLLASLVVGLSDFRCICRWHGLVVGGEVVLEGAGGGCPAERSVGSVMIVEVDEPGVGVGTLGF